MLRCIRVEVEVQLGHGRLHHAPHRLAEVRHEAHELECLDVCRADVADVRLEQHLALRRVELVVDGEVREIEEAIAHTRVLPVDDPEPLAVVQEVRIQEVVVARNRHVGSASSLDPAGDLVRPLVCVGRLPTALLGRPPIGLDHAEGVERARDHGTVVIRPKRCGDAPQHLGLAHALE